MDKNKMRVQFVRNTEEERRKNKKGRKKAKIEEWDKMKKEREKAMKEGRNKWKSNKELMEVTNNYLNINYDWCILLKYAHNIHTKLQESPLSAEYYVFTM